MIQSVGKMDRAARVLIGLALLSMLFVGGNWKWVGLLGLVPLLTALVGWHPIYGVVGVKPCPTESRR